MKFLVLVVAACAFAGVLGVPVSRQSNAGNVTDRKALFKKIKELVESHNDLIRKIEEVGGNVSDSLMKEAERINEEIRKALDQLQAPRSAPFNGPSDDEELSRTERLRKRISEIRKAITSATSELASIIWQQARAHGGKLSEQLAIAKQKVMKRLSDLKNELLVRLRELMIPDDDVPVNYVIDEVFEQIIAGLKGQIQDALKIISDWHNLLTESGRAKVAAAKKRITELAQKIADTIREWRKAKDSDATTESSNYGSDPFYNDELMLKLKELLEDFMDLLELKKREVSASSIATERELVAHFQEMETELSSPINAIREMIETVVGVDSTAYNLVANLRKLLALRMQKLQELIHSKGDAEVIRALEKEIVSLRRKLIEAVQDVFNRP